jgi:hypothetical protein
MPEWVEILCVFIAFCLGVLVMWPYKRMSERQAEFIMATQNATAHAQAMTLMPETLKAGLGTQMTREQSALKAAEEVYAQAMNTGVIDDKELSILYAPNNPL